MTSNRKLKTIISFVRDVYLKPYSNYKNVYTAALYISMNSLYI